MTMRPPADARGGLNHLVDTQIGRAFPVVHKVYQHLDAIEYVAQVYEAGRSRDIVLRTNHTKEWIEWQYKGEAQWTVLFKFSDLLGADIADVVAAEQAIANQLELLKIQIEVVGSDTLTARDEAQTAQLAAEVAQNAAQLSQQVAETSASNAVVTLASVEAVATTASELLTTVTTQQDIVNTGVAQAQVIFTDIELAKTTAVAAATEATSSKEIVLEAVTTNATENAALKLEMQGLVATAAESKDAAETYKDSAETAASSAEVSANAANLANDNTQVNAQDVVVKHSEVLVNAAAAAAAAIQTSLDKDAVVSKAAQVSIDASAAAISASAAALSAEESRVSAESANNAATTVNADKASVEAMQQSVLATETSVTNLHNQVSSLKAAVDTAASETQLAKTNTEQLHDAVQIAASAVSTNAGVATQASVTAVAASEDALRFRNETQVIRDTVSDAGVIAAQIQADRITVENAISTVEAAKVNAQNSATSATASATLAEQAATSAQLNADGVTQKIDTVTPRLDVVDSVVAEVTALRDETLGYKNAAQDSTTNAQIVFDARVVIEGLADTIATQHTEISGFSATASAATTEATAARDEAVSANTTISANVLLIDAAKTTAEAAALAAEGSKDAAALSESNAKASEDLASASATSATAFATGASGSASAAEMSASQAASSASSASTSADTATTKAAEAAASAIAAIAAAESLSTAATKASEAAASATAASDSAITATTKAAEADASALSALSSSDDAAAKYKLFDKRYLGSKTDDPTTDNYGQPLLVGAEYWNSVAGVKKVWAGTEWLAVNAVDLAVILAALTTDLSTKAPIDNPTFTGTVSGVTKAMVGLSNADNTSDLSKPISTATQAALEGKAAAIHTHDAGSITSGTLADERLPAIPINKVTDLQVSLNSKQDTLISGTNLKTVNGESILGSGDLVVGGGGSSGPTLQGDTAPYVTQTKTYQITNYNSFSSYSVAASAGTASLSGDTITFTAPASPGDVSLTLSVDGQSSTFTVVVQAAGITQPTNVSPVNGATGTSNVPVLQSSAFSAYGLTDTQAAARWTIYQDGLEMHSSGWSTTELSSYSVPDDTLALSMTYSWTVEHRGTALGDSPVSVPTTFTVLAAGINKPTITIPIAEATGVAESPTITADAFATYGLADTHLNTDWELWTGPNRTGTKVASLYNSTTSKTSWAIAAGLLTTSTSYYPAVMYRGTNLGSSEWAVSSFTTAATFNNYIPIPAPTPANYGDPFEGGFYMGLFWNQIMQSSSSKTLATGTQVFTVPDMTAVPKVYAGQQLEVRSRANPANKFIGTVAGAIGTSLTLTVSSIKGSGTFSDWSVMSRFRHIEAPKASGEHAGIALKSTNTALPVACQTLTEGWEATLAMVAAGDAATYPAAHWARNLTIGGKNDWHIPARDVLELSWRNGKPTTDPNYVTANRPTVSTFNYMNNGSYGDTANAHGINNNSVPIGATYTASVPAQTTATAFRTGGAEAFEYGSAYYWSSSEYNDSLAWCQRWVSSGPGYQYVIGKSNTGRVRAARRSII